MKKRIAYKIVRNICREERIKWLPIEMTLEGFTMRYERIPCKRYSAQQIKAAKNKMRKCFFRIAKTGRIKYKAFRGFMFFRK